MDITKGMLRKLFHLAIIPRWVIIEMERPQTVAEHTFKMMALVMYISTRIQETFEINLDWLYMYEKTMLHDTDEALSGDIPAPFKRKYLTGHNLGLACEPLEMPKELNADYFIENSIVAIADSLEAYIYAFKYQRGNNTIVDGKEDELGHSLDSWKSCEKRVDMFIVAFHKKGYMQVHKIREIIAEQVGCTVDDVTPDKSFRDDLDFTRVDIYFTGKRHCFS